MKKKEIQQDIKFLTKEFKNILKELERYKELLDCYLVPISPDVLHCDNYKFESNTLKKLEEKIDKLAEIMRYEWKEEQVKKGYKKSNPK